jgi:serine/threonine protein phosphatase PrpC
VTEFLSSSLMAAHHQIIRYASEKGMLDTPRTTLVAAIVQGTSATWVHCGDSRLYVVRDGELLTRTRDHSYLEQQSAGVIRMDRINRNILCSPAWARPPSRCYDVTGPVTLQQGDKILLCSDGLWGTLADIDIVQQLSTQPVSDAVPDLVEMALRNGGDHCDNVTVIAFEWETPTSFESTRGISTDSIRDGVFASTIQAGVLDTMVEDLDDAAIERSIAEINEAIRRSAARKG